MEEYFKKKNKNKTKMRACGGGGATVGDMCMARNLFKFGKKTQTILRYQSNKECLVERMPSVGQQKALPEGEIVDKANTKSILWGVRRVDLWNRLIPQYLSEELPGQLMMVHWLTCARGSQAF